MSATKFLLGKLLTTYGAIDAAEAAGHDLRALLLRHAAGDWGDLTPEDKRSNDAALADGSRLLSAYVLRDGAKLWIITEADRSATTVLLADEY